MGEKYNDTDGFGTYQTSPKQFPNPRDVNVYPGYGANKEDLERGFCKPTLREDPEYDAQNYWYRYSEPKVDDLVEDGPGLPKDYEFRQKDRVSKGFLTRPRIPTER